jgi:hypothetical protein
MRLTGNIAPGTLEPIVSNPVSLKPDLGFADPDRNPGLLYKKKLGKNLQSSNCCFKKR